MNNKYECRIEVHYDEIHIINSETELTKEEVLDIASNRSEPTDEYFYDDTHVEFEAVQGKFREST